MKILVTGGAGFIGSHVVDAYIAAGHDVVVVDNLSSGTKKFLNPQAKFYACDITSLDLKDVFEKERPDIVNHHAAQMNVRLSLDDPVTDARVNVLGLLRVLECSVQFGVKRFIFSSSGGAIYGNTGTIPTPEDTAIAPLSPYGLAKYVGEQYIALFHRLHGLSFVVLRYANIYGPRQNPKGESGVITLFINTMLAGEQPTIFGSGEQTRDYVFVDDVVAANILALEKGSNMVFNLGTGIETSVTALFTQISSQLGFTGTALHTEEVKGEVAHNALLSTRAAEHLGWKPTHTLEQGLAKTIAWFREVKE